MYTFRNKRSLNDVYFGTTPIKTDKCDEKKFKKGKNKDKGKDKDKDKNKDKNKDKDKDSDSDSDSDNGENERHGINLGGKHSGENIERDYNHVYFHSEVNRETIFELCNLIKEAEEENIITSHKLNIDPIPIYLHINSMGGSVYAGFMAIDIIKACKVPVYSISEGAVASAGTLISVVCNKRFIRPNAHMLIHQLSAGCWGKMSEIEDEYKHLEELMKKIKDVYIEHASIPKKELTELLKHDIWLDSDKCIKYGLVDELWTK